MHTITAKSFVITQEDIKLILDLEEEDGRKGNFERIFPDKDNIDLYSNFFEMERYNNLIIWNWLKNPQTFTPFLPPENISIPHNLNLN